MVRVVGTNMKTGWLAFAGLFCALVAPIADAQFNVVITGGRDEAVPIAVVMPAFRRNVRRCSTTCSGVTSGSSGRNDSDCDKAGPP